MKPLLCEAILGGWELSSFTSRDVDTGAVSLPLGEHPQGLIVYTADRYMSAQLARAADGEDYIAYGGRFSVDEHTATVRHDVTVSMLPELLGAPQYRRAGIDGDRLTLSATTTNAGVTTHNTLIWNRAVNETPDATRYSPPR